MQVEKEEIKLYLQMTQSSTEKNLKNMTKKVPGTNK